MIAAFEVLTFSAYWAMTFCFVVLLSFMPGVAWADVLFWVFCFARPGVLFWVFRVCVLRFVLRRFGAAGER